MDSTRLIWLSLASVVFLSLIHVLADVVRWNGRCHAGIGRLVAFYGMAPLVEKPQVDGSSHGARDATGLRVWIHLVSYAFYIAIIGYLIVQMNNPASIAIFVVSMAAHFLVVDYRLMEIHRGIPAHRALRAAQLLRQKASARNPPGLGDGTTPSNPAAIQISDRS